MDSSREWKTGRFLFGRRNLDYAAKGTEWRKVWLINRFFSKGKCLDLGCGPGEYGPVLKKVCGEVEGVDLDGNLLDIAAGTGAYSALFNRNIVTDPDFGSSEFDYVWASEVVEHMPDLSIIDCLERICNKAMVITVPNPVSPHFREDPTHILDYSVSSFIAFFCGREHFSYRVCGLGFNEVPFNLPLRKLSTFMLYFIPWLSPTIAVVGVRKTREA
jgi:SAM-dependent methyltransferase